MGGTKSKVQDTQNFEAEEPLRHIKTISFLREPSDLESEIRNA